MNDAEKAYVLAFDELNVIVDESIANANGDVKKVKEDFLDFLIAAYQLGVQAVGYALGETSGFGVDLLEEALYLKIEGLTFEDRVEEHYESGDYEKLKTLAESEFHRVYNTAVQNTAKQWQTVKNEPLRKQWVTMKDDRVRDTHVYIDDMIISINEDFYTFDGDHAPAPGMFKQAKNNVNCRCHITILR